MSLYLNILKKSVSILSDIIGFNKSPWILEYKKFLSPHFEIDILDINELVSSHIENLKDRHEYFIDSGIDEAISKLIELKYKQDIFIGFSIGGTILWKYKLKTNSRNDLICVSSTRLRLEESTPNGKNLLIFGDFDKNIPSQNWIDRHKDINEIYLNKDHDFFKEPEDIKTMCMRIIDFCS